MAGLNANPSIAFIDLYTADTTIPSGYSVGALEFGSNGKAFRLVRNGASALVVGNVLQSSAVDAQFDGLVVPTAVPAGATTVTVTNGTTAVLANQFDGGSLVVSTSSTASANIGEEYTIVGHNTPISGGAFVIQIDRPLRTAWTTATTTVAVRRSPWSGVIQSTGGAATGTAVGVCIFPCPASTATVPQFTWVQTKGVAAVLSDGSTFAVGSLVGPSVSVAGGAGVFVAGTARTSIGDAMSAANSGHAISVNLRID